MLINLRKLISDLLITFTRDNKFIELIRVLTSQAVDVYNEFNTGVSDFRYKAKANASVLSLQHHIKRELDVDILITPLDGKPIDYLVSVIGFADEKKISQILDTYGLASRSYVFDNSEPFYSSSFINYACESLLSDNLITLSVDGDTGSVLLLTAQHAVTSRIFVKVKLEMSGFINYLYPVFEIGTTSADWSHQDQAADFNQIVAIIPDIDDTYRYTFENTIINRG